MILALASCVFVGDDVHGVPEPKVTIFDGATIVYAKAICGKKNHTKRQRTAVSSVSLPCFYSFLPLL